MVSHSNVWDLFDDLQSEVIHRADGTILVREKKPVPPYPVSMNERLAHWANVAPERVFLAERNAAGEWLKLTYGEALRQVRALAGALHGKNLSAERPIVILSGNEIEHALLTFAAYEIGVPVCPVSAAYSLMSSDLSKIKYVYELLTPGLVYASERQAFAKALALAPCETMDKAQLRGHLTHSPAPEVKVTGETIAKFLLTSGSTGMPKAVVNTQNMLCQNIAMVSDAFKFVKNEPPILVDWLPWNHTFGGNQNFHIMLYNGGTMYIDAGKPMPNAIETTIKNLREIAPTVYFNVPKGLDMLLPHLQADEAFAKHFFSRLNMICYAGAALSKPTWDGYQALMQKTLGRQVVMLTCLGSTETAPAALSGNVDAPISGVVGKPLYGVTIKLLPSAGKLEARLKSGTITPAYWRMPDLTAKAFDEEGFYILGDALKPFMADDYASGFIFDGRIAEDFKLGSGTWVSVGPLRAALITALAPLARDVVVAGHDREELAIIVIPADASQFDKAAYTAKLKAYNAGGAGSSTRVKRLTVLQDALSIDVGEVTDKGSINQRALLAHRHQLVADLYAEKPPEHVVKV